VRGGVRLEPEREDHGELLEGRAKEKGEAPPENSATTTTTALEPHRNHREWGYGVKTEATGTKREVTKKEQERGVEVDATRTSREVTRSEGTIPQQERP